MPEAAAFTRWAYATDRTPLQYQVWTQADLRWVDEDGRWPGLATLVRVQTTSPAAEKKPLSAHRLHSAVNLEEVG